MSEKCESCGNHPAAYTRESFICGAPRLKICCPCADKMISYGMKETLGIREIEKPAPEAATPGA